MAAPVAGRAKVDASGRVMPLGPRPAPDLSVTADDVKDASKLARFVGKLYADVAALRARWYPRSVDFEDIVVTVGNDKALHHGFNARVRWWVVDWVSTGGGSATQFETQNTTDANTLVLYSGESGVATIRVEEAG